MKPRVRNRSSECDTNFLFDEFRVMIWNFPFPSIRTNTRSHVDLKANDDFWVKFFAGLVITMVITMAIRQTRHRKLIIHGHEEACTTLKSSISINSPFPLTKFAAKSSSEGVAPTDLHKSCVQMNEKTYYAPLPRQSNIQISRQKTLFLIAGPARTKVLFNYSSLELQSNLSPINFHAIKCLLKRWMKKKIV